MAEKHLRETGVPELEWPLMRFRWAENPAGGPWASIVVEVERRGTEWIVVRLDRNRDVVAEVGFKRVG